MSCLRCFYSNLTRHNIPDFPDHNDIGVLTQKSFEGGGEIESCFGIDVDLIDTGQVDFHRVFRSGDIDGWLIQDRQPCIKGYGFTGTRRTGNQYQSLWLADSVQIMLFLIWFKA